MDQLINQITARTGITHDQAQQAVDTVVNYLKSRLPAPLAGQIDGLLGGRGEHCPAGRASPGRHRGHVRKAVGI